MPPRLVQKNAGSTAQKKTAAKPPSKFSKTAPKSVTSAPPKVEPETVEKAQPKPSPKTPPKSVSSAPPKAEPEKPSPKTPAKSVSPAPPKAEPETVEKAQSKSSPIVETLQVREKAIEPCKDLNQASVEAQNEKESTKDADKPYAEDIEEDGKRIALENKNKEINTAMNEASVEAQKDKESTKNADKPSAEGIEEDGKRIALENKNKEIDTAMHDAHDNEGNDTEQHNELSGNGHEESVEGDRADVEMPAMVKERIKQKEFEVFVGGLDKDVDEEDLKKVFSEIGEVVEIRLPKNSRTQKNKSFAFVRFATVEQAKKAVVVLKNPQVRGKQCQVARSQDNETLHLRNICKSWTKEVLQQKLTEYGIHNMEEITLMEDLEQEGTNRGFAFLEFPTHVEATNALVRLQKPDVFFGTELRAKVAFAKSGIEPDEEVMAQVKSVFVDGLPPSWDEESVLDKFKSYGEIEEVELARNMPAAKRKDFGFISFRTREAALACIEGVNKNEVNGEEDKKVTLRATLRKPQQKGRSVKGNFRAGYGGVPWVRGIRGDRRMGAPATRFGGEGGRGFLDERRQFQHFGRAYDNRRQSGPGPAPAPARRNYREHEEDYLDRRAPAPRNYREHEDYVDRQGPARRNYREDEEDYVDRRALPSGRPTERVSSYSNEGDYGYRGAAGYSESMPPRRPIYPEDSYSFPMNGNSAYHGGAGGVCGSKRPYSDVGDDFPSPGRHSRSRLDYSVGGAAADSRYKRVSRQGQDSQQGFSAGSRIGASYSNDYLTRGNDVGGGQYASGGYGRGSGSASYY